MDKPYVVQLIVNNKPELVTLNHIKLAKTVSQASISSLIKAFKLFKFREFTREKALPIELTQYIENFIEHNI